MTKKQALGKGLGALLPEMDLNMETLPLSEERVQELPVDSLHANPAQPRQSFEPAALQELAESIRAHGIMQPLLVTEDGGDYAIVAGERRWRAAQLAGLAKVPCIIRSMSQESMAELALIENIQREDLSPLEEAEAYEALIRRFGYTQEKLAERLGKSRPYVANTLRLQQLFPQEKAALLDGRISAGHARCLLGVTDEMARGRILAAILRQRLTVREAEALAAEARPAREKKQPDAAERRERALIRDLEKQLTRGFGLKSHLQGSREKGRLIVEYKSGSELDAILELLEEARS